MILSAHIVILPILIPAAAGVAGLLCRGLPRLRPWIALGGMAGSLAAAIVLFFRVQASDSALVFQAGGWAAPFGITFVADMLSAFFVVMSQAVLSAGVVYAMGSRDACVKYPAFYPLFLFLATGLTGAFLTGDVFNLFVFIELLAISSTVLTAISDDRFGTEAAYKYFYMSQLAAFFMLLAVGALYVSCGTLNMAHLARIIPELPKETMLPMAVAFLTAAFMIKSATFPFHFWQPDFHAAAPTPVSAMLSSVVVKLGVYGFIRMTTLVFLPHAQTIQILLTILGIAGIAYGGAAAIATHNVKRMLAYSTLAQVGFILVGIGWGTALSLTAALVFAFNHSIVKSAMLMLAGFLASRAPVKSADFSVVTGVGRVLPGAGLLFFMGSLGLAGIPPTNGFMSKMMVFDAGVRSGHVYGLALIGASSVLTLVYTMRAFMRIFWETSQGKEEVKPQGDCLAAPAILVVMVLGLGIMAGPLVDAAQEAAVRLSDTGAYITAVMGGEK
ncbi:MAG: proton-conducting transporter membrane subunit [Desulfobacter sp.]